MLPWNEQLKWNLGTLMHKYEYLPFENDISRAVFGYCGGLILVPTNFSKLSYSIYTNTGKKICTTASFNLESPVLQVGFTSKSYIVFLLKNGTIVSYSPNGVRKSYFNDPLTEVTCFSQNYLGFTYVANNSFMRFFSFEKMMVTKNQAITDGPQICKLQNEEIGVFVFAVKGEVFVRYPQSLTSIFKTEKETITNIITGIGISRVAILTNSAIYIKNISPTIKSKNEYTYNYTALSGGWLNEDILFCVLNTGELILISNDHADIDKRFKVLSIVDDYKCIRVYTPKGLYMFTNIPDSIGKLSTPTCKRIFESYSKFTEKSIDFYMGTDKTYTDEINMFICAAKDSILKEYQKIYLKIASFLRATAPSVGSAEFTQTVEFLRIFNTLNGQDIGMCLTPEVLGDITGHLFKRLVNLSFFTFCEHLTEFLGIKKHEIAEKWVISDIMKNRTDHIKTVCEIIEKHPEFSLKKVVAKCNELKIDPDKIKMIICSTKEPVQKVIMLTSVDKLRMRAKEVAMTSENGFAILHYLITSPNLMKDLIDNVLFRNYFGFMRYKIDSRFNKQLETPRTQETNSRAIDTAKIMEMVKGSEGYRKSDEDIFKIIEHGLVDKEKNNIVVEALMSSIFEPGKFGKQEKQMSYIIEKCNMSKYTEFFVLQNYINVQLGNLAPSGDVLSPRQCINACYANGKEDIVEKIAHRLKLSDREVEFSKLRSIIKNKSLDLFDKFVRDEQISKHISPAEILDMLLFYRCETLVLRFLNMLNAQLKSKLTDEALNYAKSVNDGKMIQAFEKFKLSNF